MGILSSLRELTADVETTFGFRPLQRLNSSSGKLAIGSIQVANRVYHE